MRVQARSTPPPQTPRRRWALAQLWQRRPRGRLGRLDHGASPIQTEQVASFADLESKQTKAGQRTSVEATQAQRAKSKDVCQWWRPLLR